MIKITEAKCSVVIMVPVHVQLLYLVIDMLTQLNILRSRSATLILVSRDVCPEGLQIGQAVPGYHHISPLPLYELYTLIIVPKRRMNMKIYQSKL